jgi:hypothetical protein
MSFMNIVYTTTTFQVLAETHATLQYEAEIDYLMTPCKLGFMITTLLQAQKPGPSGGLFDAMWFVCHICDTIFNHNIDMLK